MKLMNNYDIKNISKMKFFKKRRILQIYINNIVFVYWDAEEMYRNVTARLKMLNHINLINKKA